MQLTKHTDYAFRVLIYLAGMSEERTTIQAITETFDISKTHLMKVVNELANKGWVASTRGKNGGIRLGVAPESVPTSAIYRGVVPFIILQLLLMGALWFWPGMATWLPSALK